MEHQKWICVICGFIYDPAVGMPDHDIAPGTPFESLPDGWICPECGSPMKVRQGRKGWFPGCSKYPKCRGTREVSAQMQEQLAEAGAQ